MRQNTLRHLTCVCALLLLLAEATIAGPHLSTGRTLSISATTAAVSTLGILARNIPPGRKPRIRGHLPFERRIQRLLAGDGAKLKSNFLDSEIGGFATPFLSGVALSAINLRYPSGSRGKQTAQDLFLFVTGALTTKGITDIAKGLAARERPIVHYPGVNQDAVRPYSHSYLQHSFFSGHTSGAFYTMTYLNLRLRETMRTRMTHAEYRSWRWVSPVALFGWASFVGLTRIQSLKHHPSDVLAGAAVGTLLGELFYNLADSGSPVAADTPRIALISIQF